MEPHARKITLPRTLGGLRAWFKGSDQGRALLGRLTQEALDERCRACDSGCLAVPRVLVVARRLGPLPGVEVYYESGVNLRCEELIDTRDDVEIERLADELLVAQLPRTWRGVAAYGRRQSLVFSGLTASRRIRALDELQTLRELREIASEKEKKR